MSNKRNLGILGAIIGTIGVATVATLRKSLAQTRGTLTLGNLHHPVEIFRDRWGVPHIYAQNTHDLFVAQGFVHAQDRLWQMESQRRLGFGRLSEIVGKRAINTDRYMRILGLGRAAQRDVSHLSDEARATIEAYVSGVNAFIQQHRTKLPPEFLLLRHTPEPWQVVDVLVWGKVMALSLSGNWPQEVLRAQMVSLVGTTQSTQYQRTTRSDMPFIVPPDTTYTPDIGQSALNLADDAQPWLNESNDRGSNNWVVSGSRTKSGQPLLANDPHLGLTVPSIWYEVHLHAPEYQVAGASFAGVPGVIIGHNNNIAWGVTNSMTDLQDLYMERFDLSDAAGLRYEYQGEWHHAELLYETINVKGGAPVIEPVRVTHHGPIITPLTRADGSRENNPLALRWTALDRSTLVDSILTLNRAHDWESFRNALQLWDVPPQNFVYADVAGNIGYQLAGHIPIRAQGDGKLPVPGWSGDYEWQGFIPFAQLPTQYNPREGFIVTANNQIVADDVVPPVRGEWSNGWRAARIRQLINQYPLHDNATFARIHADQRSLSGLELVTIAGRLPDGDALSNQARAILSGWDGELHVDSIAATIAVQLFEEIKLAVFAPVMHTMQLVVGFGAFASRPGQDYMARSLPHILAALTSNNNEWFDDGRTWDQILALAWPATLKTMRKKLGDDPVKWRYGNWHTLQFTHPLGALPVIGKLFSRGPYPFGGNGDTVNVCGITTSPDGVTSYSTASLRIICDPSDWEQCRSIHPVGQSGHFLSQHYADFIKPWLNTEYHPMPWDRRRVEEMSQEKLTLTP
ncbi:MAG: penicillin acylase family protein [Chloroflexi bacterium]|nr:penicillin acylase family protein [Chloroflexota bacterium]